MSASRSEALAPAMVTRLSRVGRARGGRGSVPARHSSRGSSTSGRNVARLLARGVDAAEVELPRLECRAGTDPRPPRALPTRLSRVTIAGANASERLALTRLLGLGTGKRDTLDFDLLRRRMRSLATASEAYESVWLNPTGAGDSVELDLVLKRAARRVAGLGLAYDNELGGRMWAGGVDRRFLNRAIEASGALFLGELRRELSLGLRRNYQVGRQLFNPTLTARLASEDVRRFDARGDEIAGAKTHEARGFAGIERSLAPGWILALGAEGRTWDEPDRKDLSTLGGLVRVTGSSRQMGRIFLAEAEWTGVYRRLALEGTATSKLGVVHILPRIQLGWGDGLPLQAGFALGGDEGFPGYHIGERRGDRVAVGALLFVVPIKGPLLGRLELASGWTDAESSRFPGGGWTAGVRAGVGAETPVGPVRFEYGVGLRGRNAFLVRLGRWF